MEREQDPPAEKEQPTETDEATSRTVGLLDEQPQAGPRSAARRPWSARRIPAAVVGLIIAVAAGALLFDVVRVRAGQAAAGWRRRLAEELASRPLDDPAMQIGAALIAVLGLWLIILALSPGLRRQLPLETPDASMHPVLDRGAAELKLRDAAMRVPGVSAAKVRFFQHRVQVRANVRFRDPVDVKADLLAALREALDRLALARPPSLDVRVRPHRK
ncbi:DUF6286 domain-containing protein [Streptomyces sp. R33]|uniref:DUF6286 domain-containing protein n=1 Tax=Streptomyces sp. R33 TaxID=3238629 RepID=A0AB39XV83_9ACTN